MGLARGSVALRYPCRAGTLASHVTYATLYADQGNLLNLYARREDVEAAVLEVVQRDPDAAGEFGFFAFDEDGEREGPFVSGAELLARPSAPAR